MNKVRFSDIPDKIKYDPSVDATLNSMLSDIVEYVSKNFDGSRKYKIKVVNLINSVVYRVSSKDSFNWNSEYPFDSENILSDDNILKSSLKSHYLDFLDIYWDIPVTSKEENGGIDFNSIQIDDSSNTKSIFSGKVSKENTMKTNHVSNKEDLYIQSPVCPRFDTKSVWMSGDIDGNRLVIYETLPKIPTKQCDISVTTDVSKFSAKDLLNLYPNTTIRTRHDNLYDSTFGLSYDPLLGCILPISVFSEDDVKENIMKYPHFFKLKKEVDGNLYNFYSTIEIDGELYKTMDIWDSLPESSIIPRNINFIKDYVVRRYLLERDVLHVEHKYPMYGDLSPYLTLFTTVDNYRLLGIEDPVEIARMCVEARVKYKKSRNPIIRRLTSDV